MIGYLFTSTDRSRAGLIPMKEVQLRGLDGMVLPQMFQARQAAMQGGAIAGSTIFIRQRRI